MQPRSLTCVYWLNFWVMDAHSQKMDSDQRCFEYTVCEYEFEYEYTTFEYEYEYESNSSEYEYEYILW